MQYEIMRKVIIKRLVLFLTLSILSLNAAYMVVGNFVKNYSGQGRLEISSKNVQDSMNGITGNIYLSDVYKLRDELQDCDVAYTSETDCFLQNGTQISAARLVLTDNFYKGFSGLDIVRGSFLSKDACQRGRNLAVISEKAAKMLYSSYNIIGSEIDISGMKYRIAGIYRSSETLLSYLGNDGMDRVYVPLESMENYKKQAVETIYAAGDTIAEDEFRLHSIDVILSEKLYLNTAALRISDFYGLQPTMKSIMAFCVFCAGLYVIWIAASGAFKALKAACLQVKRNGENYYFLESIKVCRFDILKSAAAVLFEFGIAYATFLAVRFTPYLPSQIIPQENIFDFGFYAGKIKDVIINSNITALYSPSRLAEAGNNALRLEVLLLLIAAAMFALAVSQLKLMYLSDCPFTDIINPIIASTAASLLLTMLFALAAGFEMQVAAKQMAVAFTVVILYAARNYKAMNVFLLQSYL